MKIRGNTIGIPNPQPDWNQTDSTQADYIKNKPGNYVTISSNPPESAPTLWFKPAEYVYTEEAVKTWGELEERVTSLEESLGAAVSVVAAEQKLTFTEATGHLISDSLVLTEPLVAGNSYRVVWGDTEFVCRCYAKAEGGGVVMEGAFLGNASIFLAAMPDTGEPFVIGATDDALAVIKRTGDPTTKIAIYSTVGKTSLPAVTPADNDKFLRVVGGEWAVGDLPDGLATEDYVEEYVATSGLATESFVQRYVRDNVPSLDTTLSQAGKAADAGAVGQVLTEAMQTINGELANKQHKGNYVQTVNGQTPDENGNVSVASVQPTSIDLSQYESGGRIVETFADGTTKTTTVEFNGDGKPVKITDSAGNTMNLTW